MKVFFAANKYVGSSLRISRLIADFPNHKILAPLYNSHYFTYVDYLTDGLLYKKVKIFKPQTHLARVPTPKCNKICVDIILKELKEWGVELIVSDLEPISAYIAKSLNVPLFYVTPLRAVKYEAGKFNKILTTMHELPIADKVIVYYPFITNDYDHVYSYNDKAETIINDPEISSKYKFLKESLEGNHIFSAGETDYLADALNENKKIYIMPKYKDYESMVNAHVFEKYGLGIDIGTINSSNSYIKYNLEKELKPVKDTIPVNKTLLNYV